MEDVLAGDVDMESCVGVAGAITPVPGGVALLTTAMLMNNTLKAFVLQNDLTMYYNSFSSVALNVDNWLSVCFHFPFSMQDKLSVKRPSESTEWNERYSRQIRLEGVGVDGQVWFMSSTEAIEKNWTCKNISNRSRWIRNARSSLFGRKRNWFVICILSIYRSSHNYWRWYCGA